MVTLRSAEAQKKYSDYRKSLPSDAACPLCEESAIKDFVHWRIITNNFPYDNVAEVHHMIVPRRHVTETELTAEEMQELLAIKHDFINHQEYDWIIEATTKKKSIPAHFHLHLIVGKA